MNDIRRTLLWVVFSFSLIMLWDQWQIYNGRPATFFAAAPKPAATASAPASGVPAASAPGADATAATPPGVAEATPAAPIAPAIPRERIEVTTDVLKLVFDTEGGSIVRSEFLKYPAQQDQPDQPFVLLDSSAERVYHAQSGLIGGAFPTHKTPMAFSGERALADGADTLTLRFESPEVGGVRLNKIYTLKRGSYLIDVRHEVVNASAQPVTPRLYVQLVRDGNKPAGETTSFYSTFTGPAFYTDAKKFQKVDFTDIEKNKADIAPSSPDGWVAMVQHYFASAWLLPAGQTHDNFARKIDNNLYAAGMISPETALAPGATHGFDASLFIGPQQERMLEGIAPGLELVKDYGMFTVISKPLYWLLAKLHGVLGNWGWAIVALVFLLKILFYPLNAKAYASMAKMKAINPRIMEMRERLKDDPRQMQAEMMRIYREEKVNPMGGCLPIVVQIPVFIALYWVLLSSVEMRGAPWMLWIHDLSAKDPYFILPVVMALTQLLQIALNPQPPDPMQAKMMWIMPLAFSVMFFFFPAGLVLYWITQNILTIAQQWLINTRMGVPPQFNLPKF
jgi:YidC/Oxa1 family membrane protein insertase